MLSKRIKFALLPLYVDVRNYPFKGNSRHVHSDQFFSSIPKGSGYFASGGKIVFFLCLGSGSGLS